MKEYASLICVVFKGKMEAASSLFEGKHTKDKQAPQTPQLQISHFTINVQFRFIRKCWSKCAHVTQFSGQRSSKAAHWLFQLFHQCGGTALDLCIILQIIVIIKSVWRTWTRTHLFFFVIYTDKKDHEGKWEDHKRCWSNVVSEVRLLLSVV